MPGLLVFSGADYTTSGRITALAIDPSCTFDKCRLWVGAAGGGVWRTKNAMADSPSWTFVSGGLPTNAIGALTYDASSNTLYAGTGEPNASADSETGSGLFKSTDGGDTWTHVAAITSTTISRSTRVTRSRIARSARSPSTRRTRTSSTSPRRV
jgi:hypothetical protein